MRRRRAPPPRINPNPTRRSRRGESAASELHGQYVLPDRAADFDELFSLCSSNSAPPQITYADFLLILQSLNLVFDPDEYLSLLQKLLVDGVPSEDETSSADNLDELLSHVLIGFDSYQQVINYCLDEKPKTVSRNDEFSIFTNEAGDVDVAAVKHITSLIGEKLESDELESFFAELEDFSSEVKEIDVSQRPHYLDPSVVRTAIPAEVLYDYIKCQ